VIQDFWDFDLYSCCFSGYLTFLPSCHSRRYLCFSENLLQGFLVFVFVFL
jgi:hypothetical protein